MDKWNELCFMLSESIPSNTTEQIFELKVIQAFEKLGWSQFKNEIVVRESIHLGASNRISPDLVLKSAEKGNLFIVEVKKPSLEISNSNFENQLSSYMGILRVEIGLLVGEKIQLYIDGKLFSKEGLILIEEIEFKRNSEKGLKFVELFKKENFELQNIIDYSTEKINQLKEIEIAETLKQNLLSKQYVDTIKNSIKSNLLQNYNEHVIDKVLNDLEITVTDKNKIVEPENVFEKEPKNYGSFIKSNSTRTNTSELPIGKYVKETLNQLIIEDRISRDEIEKLQRADYSKQTFDIQFSFLKKRFPPDSKERIRYWKNPVVINGEQFFVCSQWYEVPANNDRPYYESWLKRMRKKE